MRAKPVAADEQYRLIMESRLGRTFRYWCMCIYSDRKGKIVTAVNYTIYSRQGMTASEYGESARSHWGIENSLRWILDMAFREDESRIRANAAENMNIARHIGINLLKQEKSCKMGVASKRKKCSYDKDYLFKVLAGLNTGIE